MAVWSKIVGAFGGSKLTQNVVNVNKINNRWLSLSNPLKSDHGPRVLPITPSRFQWDKFKDMIHYYFLVGLIPIGIVVFCTNVFVGPATLTPIPEGYTPKYWEFSSHPITRFIHRYIQHSPQQDYEKYLHHLYEEREKMLLRELEYKIKTRMAANADYQSYYYRPVTAKYFRAYKEAADEMMNRFGDQEK